MNGSPKFTWNQMRQATPTVLQLTTKYIQSSGPPLGATKHPTPHKVLQPRKTQKTGPRPTRRSLLKGNSKVQSALTTVQLPPVRQEAPQKKTPTTASQAIRSQPTATQRTTNNNSKKVSPPQTHSQFSQPHSKTTRSSCEEPLDPTHIESNDDQRNPSHKLPRAITHQEAPQPVESWHQHHSSRRRKPHKRTTLNTTILPHSEARADVRIERIIRERPQIALPTEIHGATKVSVGGKIRSGSLEETESERSEHEASKSAAENEVPKPRHYRGNTRRSDPVGRRTAPAPKSSTPYRQEPAPKARACTELQRRRPVTRTKTRHRSRTHLPAATEEHYTEAHKEVPGERVDTAQASKRDNGSERHRAEGRRYQGSTPEQTNPVRTEGHLARIQRRTLRNPEGTT